MIEINLLPDELKIRKAQKADLSEIPIRPIAIGIIIILLAAQIMFSLLAGYFKNVSDNLGKKSAGYVDDRKSLEAMNKKITEFDSKLKALDELTQGRVSWSGILNGLSDAVLDNMWMTSLLFESNSAAKQVLYLEGSALGQSEEATALVGKFISSLKNSGPFIRDFEDIELESIRGGVADKQEVMNFRLACIMKETEESKRAKEKLKKDAEAKAARKAKKAKMDET